MSEYQWIHFRAVDQPLDDDALKFMRQQSSRANVSRREFTNEYNFGDFGGNTREMLRRGYDVHLHYANYGVRFLMFRLPELPCDEKTFEAFSRGYGVEWIADKRGPAGIMVVQPEGDDRYFEFLEYPEEFLDRIAPAREMLIQGDLRPLYLFWLTCCYEDDAKEPPVPAGLGELLTDACPDALAAIAEFHLIPQELIRSAAAMSPDAPERDDSDFVIRGWLAEQSKVKLQAIAESLLLGDSSERLQLTTHIRRQANIPEWPSASPSRTFGEIEAAASAEEQRIEDQRKAELELVRLKQLQTVAANPDMVIRRIDECVQSKQRMGYREAASHLKELSEALGIDFAQHQADRLRRQYPRFTALREELRMAGFDV